jgi:hypothetical protein
MLTSYMVACPHLGCDWFGSLMPKDDSSFWRGSRPSCSVIHFECPKCRASWQARIRGDDIEMLPLEELAVSVG